MTQSRKRIFKLYEAQLGLCHWCYLPMRLRGKRMNKLAATVDHLIQRNGRFRQYVLAHKLCNNERHFDERINNSTLEKIRKTVMNQCSDLVQEWSENLKHKLKNLS